jgi:hypothetical protein
VLRHQRLNGCEPCRETEEGSLFGRTPQRVTPKPSLATSSVTDHNVYQHSLTSSVHKLDPRHRFLSRSLFSGRRTYSSGQIGMPPGSRANRGSWSCDGAGRRLRSSMCTGTMFGSGMCGMPGSIQTASAGTRTGGSRTEPVTRGRRRAPIRSRLRSSQTGWGCAECGLTPTRSGGLPDDVAERFCLEAARTV